jgi:hypothetical protein
MNQGGHRTLGRGCPSLPAQGGHRRQADPRGRRRRDPRFRTRVRLPLGYFFLPPDAKTAVGLNGADEQAAGAFEQIGLASWVPPLRERIDELSLELPAKERKQILRLVAKDPGGVSERGELSRALHRLRVDLDTLAVLVGDENGEAPR